MRQLPPRIPPRLWGPIAAVLTGGLLFLSFPPYNLEPLAWIALVPLMLFARRAGWKSALLWSAALGVGLSVALVSWLHYVTFGGWFALAIYVGSYYVAFALLFRYLSRRLDRPAAFIAPALWTALEFGKGTLFTGFAWFLLGHTQYLNIPFIQAADVVGVYGLGFVMVMVGGAIVDAVVRKRRALVPIAVAALVTATAFAYGFVRLSACKTSDGPRVRLVQGNVPIGLKLSSNDEDVIAFVRRHVNLSLTPEGRSSDLVIWPETMLPVYLNWAYLQGEDSYLQFARKLRDMALEVPAQTHARLLVGALTCEGRNGPFYNSGYYYGPEGRLLGRYDKIHPVVFGEYTPLKKQFPFLAKLRPAVMGEDLWPGKDYVLFDLPWEGKSLRFAVTICFEDTVPEVVREFARRRIDFLVNISNDGWFRGSPEMDQHMAICVFRAVESRRPIARASNTGISSFIDPCGRIRGYIHDGPKYREVAGSLAQPLQMSNLSSPYVRIGDAFSYACVLASAIFLLSAFLKGGQKKS